MADFIRDRSQQGWYRPPGISCRHGWAGTGASIRLQAGNFEIVAFDAAPHTDEHMSKMKRRGIPASSRISRFPHGFRQEGKPGCNRDAPIAVDPLTARQRHRTFCATTVIFPAVETVRV